VWKGYIQALPHYSPVDRLCDTLWGHKSPAPSKFCAWHATTVALEREEGVSVVSLNVDWKSHDGIEH
jgi:hypothetical protein